MENNKKTPAVQRFRNQTIIAILAAIAIVVSIFILLYGQAAAPFRQVREEPVEPAVIALRLGHNIIKSSAMHTAALRFAQEVAIRSKGEVRVSVHPGEELGNDLQMLEMAREGNLDLLLTPTAKLSSSIPAMQYADLPFYFSSREEFYAMLDGEPGQMLLGQMKNIGLVGVTFWENGFKHFTGNRPLRHPEDFQKLRFRTMKSRLIMDQFEALGAKPVPIEFQAIYQALVDGVVDGQENPLVAIVGMNFHKVQPHLTLSSHGYLGYAFSISARVFERLSPEIRDLLTSTARELTRWEREETQRRETEFLEQVQAAGVTVYELSPDERKAFFVALSKVVHQYEPVIGADLFAKTEELRWAAATAEQREKTLLLGLDAELSGGGSEVGLAIRRGMELAANDINARGGVLGKQLRVLARDHRGIPGEGVRTLRTFSAMPEMVAVFGGKHSHVIDEELPVIHELSMPYLIPWAAASKLTDNGYQPNYVFRLSLRDQDVAPFLMKKASKGGRKVALLLEQSVWGRSNEDAIKRKGDADSTPPVTTIWFNRGDKDFSDVATAIERAGADAVVVVANSGEASLIAKTLAQNARPLPVYSHWGIIGEDFNRNTQEAISKLAWHTVSTLPMHPESSTATPASKLLDKYRKTYGINQEEAIPAFMGAAHAYDLVHLLANAIRKAGRTDHEAVRAALEKLINQPGVVHTYRQAFTAQHHDALGRENLNLVRFDRHGHLVRAE